jgi:hypothetical protein
MEPRQRFPEAAIQRIVRGKPDLPLFSAGSWSVPYASKARQASWRLLSGLRTEHVNGSIRQKAPSNGITRRIRDLVLPFFIKLGAKEIRRVLIPS